MSSIIFRAFDKTHFITASAQPTDPRLKVGSLWSKTSTSELYTCTALGPVTFALLTGGSGAPVGASYLTLGTDGTLTDERVLTAGAGIAFTDGGAGSTLTIEATGAAAASSFSRTFLLMGA